MLAPWGIDELPAPPRFGGRQWLALIGPGLVMAGAAVGAGEWLFGPAVTAQYGPCLLWLASISIFCQVFFNLQVMRYTLYCGEPVFVGYFRTWPGPKFWTGWYLLMDVCNIWPFMAASAAIPLTAAILGHLPTTGSIILGGIELSEVMFVKLLGYAIFLLAFVPLIFGRTVYRMIERLMVIKVVLVLGFLFFMVLFTVSGSNVRDVLLGFVRFGQVPLRATSVIDGPQFDFTEQEDSSRYTIRGTLEEDRRPVVTEFSVNDDGGTTTYHLDQEVPGALIGVRDRLLRHVQELANQERFFVEDTRDGVTLRIEGRIRDGREWIPEAITIVHGDDIEVYDRLDQLPETLADRVRAFVEYRGVEPVSLVAFVSSHRRLPDLDWALLAALAAIAGIGGVSNTLVSNYARDKGWGMGKRVGAIPSAFGGGMITLSHVGKVFMDDPTARERWRGWLRHITRDQVGVWMVCCFLGMALPCMLSLEFIRNVPVEGHRVAAVIADEASRRLDAVGPMLWQLTLLCSFLILGPGQVFAADDVARRWTDTIWTSSRRARTLDSHQVKYVYYSILGLYAVWGLVTLSAFDPLQLAKIGAVLANVALGCTSFHTLYVNRTLLPKAVRPGWFLQTGLIICGVYYLLLSMIVLIHL